MTGERRIRGRTRVVQHHHRQNRQTVTRLKEQIETRTYRVDSRAVAREMLFKMRMMALLRRSQRRS